MNDAIKFSGLGFSYNGKSWVFRNYSAAVSKGRVFAILGPNGRGKTTLLNLFLRLRQPTEGTMEINGSFAFVPQLFQTTFAFSVLDMVLMGRAKKIGLFSQPGLDDIKAAQNALERVGMGDFAENSFYELSGGQRQLVILARALVAKAEILIMDEPTSALDLKNQSLVLDWIRKLSKEDGLTVVFTTHHPHHALAVADDVLLMTDETEHAFGESEQVLTESNLTRLYGIPLKHIEFEYGGRTATTFVPVL